MKRSLSCFGLHLRASLVAMCALTAPFPAISVIAQASQPPAIASPTEGQDVQGQFQVLGTTDVAGFASSELAFAYAGGATRTWFVIQTASLPVSNGVITVWDTSSITDGDYALRLRVGLTDGSFHDAVVNIRVRNYTATPTATSAVSPTEKAAVVIPTAMIIVASATAPAVPAAAAATPSALPPNPAGVSAGQVYSGFWRGALLVGILILAFGALARLRR